MRTTTLTGGLAGLLLSTALAVAPVQAATVATAPAGGASAAGAAFSAMCLAEWTAVATDPSVATWRAAGDCEVDRRLATVSNLRTVIAGASAMTSAHKSALGGILDATASGLTTLKGTIDADTTLSALHHDVHAIFADYRVYAVVARQVALVRADDAATAAAAHLSTAATKIQAAIAQAQANGKDVTTATAQLAAMQTAISAAQTALDGDAAQVLAQTPAGWNAGTAGPILDAARSSIHDARGDLATALADGKAAIAALK